MSLRLILMRHAKSDWSTPVGGDFDRPLNERGRRASADVGKWLAEKSYGPELVLCSAAVRTRETWGIVGDFLEVIPEVEYLRDLYLASPDVMFQELTEIQHAPAILMMAHNPGSAVLAQALADRAPAHAQFDNYPTAATTVFEFDIKEWAALKPGSGQIVNFVVPRDLV